MPCVMSSLQSVRLGEDVFVGGGDTGSLGDDDAQTVYQYHPPTDQWVPLPQYECVWFAMATLINKLTLVGGFNTSTPLYKVTNQIAVWDTEGISRGWTHPYPPMPTPRHSPAVATHDKRLVVAGGRDGDLLATVEVLDTTSRQWLSTSPLPVKCSYMTSAIVNQELYLLGGTLTTDTLVVSLPEITRSSVNSATTNRSAQWRKLPTPPLKRSAAITVHGSVVAIGGHHGNTSSTAIHVYQPATNNWKKVGDLPSPRERCTSTLLPSGEILVAGGFDSNGKLTSRVDAAAL